MAALGQYRPSVHAFGQLFEMLHSSCPGALVQNSTAGIHSIVRADIAHSPKATFHTTGHNDCGETPIIEVRQPCLTMLRHL